MTITHAFARRIAAVLSLFGLLLLPAAASADATPRILVLGDSLSAGYGLPADDTFPARLEAALEAAGTPAAVINGGVSGDTSAGGRTRLDWMLADRPDMAIVELGGNDALRGLDPDQTYANLDAILKRLREENVAVLLAGMLAPPNMGRDYADDFAAVFPRLAEEHGVPLYPFFLDGVAADPDLNQPDGIHPNAAGVDVIVERILPHVQDVMTGLN